ncbi:uncharacterized protein BDR25DRAFT_355370 [Lindgomyces ingoldianus]|uniref:Uncharacterized protein n=1 Tax=Lindgomyces ingoldianus TaxID=673940 RepID=A0ACB6QTD1_9PLEO|nr:uncharacterized protein BDR25DRAFT_355370 [Lindgomyces ingoldianus]KAF2470259.1 hypothetical protein BDR25DRAFT_355370 [Lindgomyces ingoldianus]
MLSAGSVEIASTYKVLARLIAGFDLDFLDCVEDGVMVLSPCPLRQHSPPHRTHPTYVVFATLSLPATVYIRRPERLTSLGLWCLLGRAVGAFLADDGGAERSQLGKVPGMRSESRGTGENLTVVRDVVAPVASAEHAATKFSTLTAKRPPATGRQPQAWHLGLFKEYKGDSRTGCPPSLTQPISDEYFPFMLPPCIRDDDYVPTGVAGYRLFLPSSEISLIVTRKGPRVARLAVHTTLYHVHIHIHKITYTDYKVSISPTPLPIFTATFTYTSSLTLINPKHHCNRQSKLAVAAKRKSRKKQRKAIRIQKLASLYKRIGDLLKEELDKLNEYIEIGTRLLSGVTNVTGKSLWGDKCDWDASPGRQIRGRLSGATYVTGKPLRGDKCDWDVSPGTQIRGRLSGAVTGPRDVVNHVMAIRSGSTEGLFIITCITYIKPTHLSAAIEHAYTPNRFTVTVQRVPPIPNRLTITAQRVAAIPNDSVTSYNISKHVGLQSDISNPASNLWLQLALPYNVAKQSNKDLLKFYKQDCLLAATLLDFLSYLDPSNATNTPNATYPIFVLAPILTRHYAHCHHIHCYRAYLLTVYMQMWLPVRYRTLASTLHRHYPPQIHAALLTPQYLYHQHQLCPLLQKLDRQGQQLHHPTVARCINPRPSSPFILAKGDYTYGLVGVILDPYQANTIASCSSSIAAESDRRRTAKEVPVTRGMIEPSHDFHYELYVFLLIITLKIDLWLHITKLSIIGKTFGGTYRTQKATSPDFAMAVPAALHLFIYCATFPSSLLGAFNNWRWKLGIYLAARARNGSSIERNLLLAFLKRASSSTNDRDSSAYFQGFRI